MLDVNYICLGSQDLECHIASEKHKRNIQSCSSSRTLDTIFLQQKLKPAQDVHAAEGALAFHTAKHNSSYRSMDCTPKLNQEMYFDSDIAKKVSTARTKTECIINKVIAPHAIDVTVEVLSGISCFGVATDGSNHGCQKMFPILVQYFDYKLGGIQTKAVELKTTPNETSETIADYVKITLEGLGIVKKCVAFAGDNTNTNFGGINRKEGKNVYSILKKTVNQNLVGVGCPAHILHNTIRHGVDTLDIDVECIVLKLHNFFSIYTVRTEELKEYCTFVESNYKPLLSHSKTRWLSLFPAIERLLEMYEALKSYFCSQPHPPKILLTFFENQLSKAYLWHVHSLMSVFQKNILEIENSASSVLEVVNIIESVCIMLQNRFDASFVCLKAKQILDCAQKEGFDKEVDNFMKAAVHMYKVCLEYLTKWGSSFIEFSCFKWMNLKTVIEYSETEKCLMYLKEKCIEIDDVKFFDQFCNLCKFIQENIVCDEFSKSSASEKWAKFFNSTILECHSELLKLAEYFFSIPGHNANVERLFSLISSQWTDVRNQLSIESVKGLLVVRHNFKEFSCSDFYHYIKKKPKLLDQIGSSQKYNN